MALAAPGSDPDCGHGRGTMGSHWKCMNVDKRHVKVDERHVKVDKWCVKMGERSAVVLACGLAKSHQLTCPPSKLWNTGTGEAGDIQAPLKPLTTL